MAEQSIGGRLGCFYFLAITSNNDMNVRFRTLLPDPRQPFDSVSMVWSFLECHRVGITQHVGFSDGLLSCSTMH